MSDTSSEIVAVLGPNGRGKSTFLRCAAGLLRLREGTATITGAAGFVPQAGRTTFAYNALEMTLMGRARHIGPFGSPRPHDHAAAHAALDRVGLAHLADRPYFRLSGGEQQLVRIARALASEGRVLVLDEPAALDLANQGRVLRLLRDLVEDGIAVLLTTHHPDHAQFLAHRVMLMGDRGDSQVGDADALLTDTVLTPLYGVGVRSLTYYEGGDSHRVLTTRYE